MATLKKYNLAGKEVGSVKVDERFEKSEANSQMVKDYIVALRANARQWSANTKGRSEVKHTTKKPRPQKGTGNARQGSTVTPQYRGGGIVFGPKPKFDQHVKINKKERQAAIRFLIGEKIRTNQLVVIEDIEMKEPKTKTVADFLSAVNLGRRTLFISESSVETVETEGKKVDVSVSTDKHVPFSRSIRNIPFTEMRVAPNFSGYDVALAGGVVVTEGALKQMTEWLL